jgi:hypothetical protein
VALVSLVGRIVHIQCLGFSSATEAAMATYWIITESSVLPFYHTTRRIPRSLAAKEAVKEHGDGNKRESRGSIRLLVANDVSSQPQAVEVVHSSRG